MHAAVASLLLLNTSHILCYFNPALMRVACLQAGASSLACAISSYPWGLFSDLIGRKARLSVTRMLCCQALQQP